jgi:5'-nucleotidase
MLKILITNDDGVAAPGIVALACRLAQHAHVVVVAPEKPSSARSHCITLHKPLRLNELAPYPVADARRRLDVFACSGTPVDCVVLGLDHVCAEHKPDLVLSGINDGYNVAEDLIYSGTVGGAVEGAINRIPSISISQGSFPGMDFVASAAVVDLLIGVLVYGRTFSWQAAEQKSMLAMQDTPDRAIISMQGIPIDPSEDVFPKPGNWFPKGLQTTACLNLNLPKIPADQIKGLCWAESGQRDYVDVVQQRSDPFGRKYFWIAGERVLMEEQVGTDTWALAQGLVSATPMLFNMTSLADMQAFRQMRANQP